MNVFNSYVNNRGRFHSVVGSRYKTRYSPKYDSAGVLVLEKVGEDNLYAEIQSYKDTVDINRIIARYTAGDTSALNQRPGMYGDFTVLPNSYADLLNKIIRGQEEFNKLPLKVKQQFNNNFSEWLASFDVFNSTESEVKEVEPVKLNEEVRADE